MNKCSPNCYTKPKLIKHLKELQNTLPVKYSAWPISSQNIYDCICSIIGPENTPYENGIFYIRVSLPTHNHGTRPNIKFLTKIFHPNVHAQLGSISSFKLRGARNDLMQIIELLYDLLISPDLANPENIEAKDCYINDREEFHKMASEWKNLYAS